MFPNHKGREEPMRKIVVVALLAVVFPATAAAQWTIDEEVDPFTDASNYSATLSGEDDRIFISYACQGRLELLLVIFSPGPGTNIFGSGVVQIRFGDDPGETEVWDDNNEYLAAPVAFVRRMAQHDTLLLGVSAYRSGSVRDRFNLTGTAAMLEQIDCRAE